jgi:hypothetical protein
LTVGIFKGGVRIFHQEIWGTKHQPFVWKLKNPPRYCCEKQNPPKTFFEEKEITPPGA